MTLDKVVMPDMVRKEVNRILSDIELADGVIELTHLGGIAEGFARGLTCVGAMRAADIDAMEIAFSQAFDRRMAELRRP
ncbi:hypothetical protein J3P77_09740 [Pseudomonas sp. R1-18]|uniref:hypothetical protein n=1 Tax=Pseudomonas sp. R1-18 TaxID=1632772 RepID=UPI003DA8E331